MGDRDASSHSNLETFTLFDPRRNGNAVNGDGGDANRRFKAFDDQTGEVLWETIVSGPVTGHPISYAVNGRQYIAVPVGGGTAEPERRVLSIHPEIKPSCGINALFVFALGDDRSGESAEPSVQDDLASRLH